MANTIVPPSGRHEAPYMRPAAGSSLSVLVEPLPTLIVFSLRLATNATVRLSGDQLGLSAPSVPASACASSASSERTQSRRVPPRSAANTRRRPSGESAKLSFGGNTVFDGGESVNRTVCVSLARVPRKYGAPRAPIHAPRTQWPQAPTQPASATGGRRIVMQQPAMAPAPSGFFDIEAGVAYVAQPLPGIFFEASPEQPSNAGGRRLGKGPPVGLALEDGGDGVRQRVAGEREPAGQHLEEHTTEGPDVRPLVHGPAARLPGARGRGPGITPAVVRPR